MITVFTFIGRPMQLHMYSGHHACGQFCRKTRTSKIKRQINRKMDRIIIMRRTERERDSCTDIMRDTELHQNYYNNIIINKLYSWKMQSRR